MVMFAVARGRAGLAITGLALLAAGVTIGYHFGQPATVVTRVSMWLSPWDNDVPGGDQLAHLFERTSSGLQTDDDGYKLEGIGLSLYVSKAIINAHGGEIATTSQPSIQTQLQFRVPLEKPSERTRAREDRTPTLVG